MSIQQVYNVARREYLARIRNKAFIFTTLLVPVFLGFYMAVLPRIFDQVSIEELRMVVVDTGTGLGTNVLKRLNQMSQPRVLGELSERAPGTPDLSGLRNQVLAGELDAYMVLTPSAETSARAQYYARQTGNPVLMRRLSRALEGAAVEKVLAGSGIDVETMDRARSIDMEAVTISEKGEQSGGFDVAFITTMAFGMLLYMAVMINGQGMALAIVEEKASRLIEVILGAVTTLEFMMGKIIGVLLSGLTQLGVWVFFALLASLYALPAVAISSDIAGVDLTTALDPMLLFYFSIFFALGYFLYSTLFAALAATCSSTEELAQALFPAMLPMIVALMASFYAVPNPDSVATRVMSLIPFLTPLVMLARVIVLTPPAWEIWLGIVLLALGSFGVAWISAKIFRFALLMHGKRPTFAEMARMLRAS